MNHRKQPARGRVGLLGRALVVVLAVVMAPVLPALAAATEASTLGVVNINTATVDGAVRWTPAGEAMLGYPGGGGGPNYTFIRSIEPPRPGRPGMLP